MGLVILLFKGLATVVSLGTMMLLMGGMMMLGFMVIEDIWK